MAMIMAGCMVRLLLTVLKSVPQSRSASFPEDGGGQCAGQTHFPASQRPPCSQITPWHKSATEKVYKGGVTQ